jgi:hypothetical protein
MATVYISKDLLNRVSSKIQSLKYHEKSELFPNWSNTVKADASVLMNGIQFFEKPEVLDVIPKTWLNSNENAYINVEIRRDDMACSPSIRVEGLTAYYDRPSGRYSGVTNKCTEAYLRERLHLTGASEILAKAEAGFELESIERKWKNTEEQVVMFLGKCKSLNEAIKLWPQVALYIDDEDLERFNRKVERKAREDVLQGINTDELTAHAIAAKLSGAFNQHS